MYKKAFKLLFIILTLFVIKYIVFATDNDYKNTLLKVDLRKNANGSFNIVLQTEKPYLQKINIQKRSDSEYVIILPETFFSGMQKPSLPSNIVNLDVRLFPYLSSDLKNGFTKITISTTSKLALNPVVAALGTKPDVIASAPKQVLPVPPKTPVIVKPVEKVAVMPAKPVVSTPVKPVQQPSKPTVVTPPPTVIAVKPVPPVLQPVVPVVKPVQPATPPVIASLPKPVVAAPPNVVASKPIEPVQVQKPVVQPKSIIEQSVLKAETPEIKVLEPVVKEVLQPVIAEKPLIKDVQPIPVRVSEPQVVDTVAMNPVQEPLVKRPTFKMPKLPEFKAPTLPTITIPELKLPEFQMPKLKLPEVHMPEITLPEFKAPTMPVISMPQVKLPEITLPEFKAPTLPTIVMPMLKLPEINPVQVFGNIYQFFAMNMTVMLAMLVPILVPFVVLAWFRRKIAQADTTNIKVIKRRKELDEGLETEQQPMASPATKPAFKFIQPVAMPPKLETIPISNVHFKIRNEQESFDKFNIPKDAVKSFAKPIQISKIQKQEAKVEFDVQPVVAVAQQASIEPQLIETYNIDSQRGFYLIRYEKDTALVGFIEDAIFVLNKFKDLSIQSMRAILSHSAGDNNMFIVKSGVHRGLYRVSPSDMKFVMEL